MALSKLGDFIELVDNRNVSNVFNASNVRGISTSKAFIDTKANLDNVNLQNYKVVNVGQFAYVADTSRRGEKIGLAYADSEPCIISSIYTVFKVKDEKRLLPRYLMMFFNRSEFDRYARFNSWGSARETFSWDDFCDIVLEIPSIEIQRKYVAIYEGLLANLHANKEGQADLRLAYEMIIERYRKNKKPESVLPYIEERNVQNSEAKYNHDFIHGVGQDGFIEPKQHRDFESLKRCNIFYRNDFVYNPSVLYAGAIALNKQYETGICTEEYIVFHVKNESVLKPEYLFMWLKRSECGRYIDFKSVDSVRNRVYFRDLEMIEIPIVNIDQQNIVASIYNSYVSMKEKEEKLNILISSICPLLIRGSIEESKGGSL